MKKTYLFIVALCCVFFSEAQTYEYQVITSVESIIPSGAGRSRLISTDEAETIKILLQREQMGKKQKIKEINLTAPRLELRISKKLNCLISSILLGFVFKILQQMMP